MAFVPRCLARGLNRPTAAIIDCTYVMFTYSQYSFSPAPAIRSAPSTIYQSIFVTAILAQIYSFWTVTFLVQKS